MTNVPADSVQLDAPGPRNPILRLTGLALGIVVAADLCVMTLITVVDVVGRYCFNAPLAGADELTTFAMAVAVFGGLPLLAAHDGHVTVDILTSALSQRLRRALDVFVNAFTGAFMAFVAWQLLDKALATVRYGDVTVYLNLPMAPVAYFIAVMGGVAALATLARAAAGLMSPPDTGGEAGGR